MGAFDTRTVLVTGAGRGIGRAIAVRFARDGARVVVNDVDPDVASETAAEIDGVAAPGSVADAESCESIVAASGGQLDVLVNNAGITRDAMAHKMTDEVWDTVVDVILRGTFLMSRAAAPLLRGSREHPNTYNKKVVNITSVNGIYGTPANANYSAAKAGVIGLTKTLAREWARNRVNVNAVAPGYIAGTRMTQARGAGDTMGIPQAVIDAIEDTVPIGRPGTPDDIAGVCAFLASTDADYVTGQVIEVHGGREIMDVTG